MADLPFQHNKKAVFLIITLLSCLILMAVALTLHQLYQAVLEGKRASLLHQTEVTRSFLQSDKYKLGQGFIKTLLEVYHGSLRGKPEVLNEMIIAAPADGRLFLLASGRGNPADHRDPDYFYLLDRKGNPRTITQKKYSAIARLALAGKSGVASVEDASGEEVLLAYAPLEIDKKPMVVALSASLGPIKFAFWQEAAVVLVLALLVISAGVWIFMRMNPLLQELSQVQKGAISMLGKASHFKDTDTGWHVERMAAYSVAIARALGLSAADRIILELAAKMHDLGKVGTPDNILKKPAKLNRDEWTVMQRHAEEGGEILSREDTPLFKMAREIALGHHEKFNGQGYPQGLKGEDIPLPARITAVADVFDALTMRRPYKEPWPVDRALKAIKDDTGSHFDPKVVEAFLSVKDEILAIKEYWEEKERLEQEHHGS